MAQPAIPAKPEPIAKVRASTWAVGMPKQALMVRFWVTERMRNPQLERLKNK